MFGRSGNDGKLKIKIRTVKALKKYCNEPKCLRCGYDVRGQYMAGLVHCSECGQGCSHEDLAEKIANQRASRMPVVTEVRSGVMLALAYPLFALIATGLFVQLLHLVGLHPGGMTGAIILVLHGLVYLALLLYSGYKAYRVAGSWRGVLYWCLSFLYAFLFLLGIQPIAGWVILLIVTVVANFLEDSRELFEIYTQWWLYASLPAGALVLFVNEYWHRRILVKPCRRRCRELVVKWLKVY